MIRKEKEKEKRRVFGGASLKLEKVLLIMMMIRVLYQVDKDGFWAKKNSKEGYIENMKDQITKLQRKVKKLEKRSKKKKEGFANLRQNRRLKLNHISVLNTTDLDRIIKKDSEIRTLNSTA